MFASFIYPFLNSEFLHCGGSSKNSAARNESRWSSWKFAAGHRRRRALWLGAALACASIALSGCSSYVVDAAKANAAALSVSTDAVSFGDVTVGAVASASVSLMNTGNVSIQITQIQVAGQPFSVGKLAVPIALAPGSSYALALHFSPTVEGDASG